jgi:hypothetical protein
LKTNDLIRLILQYLINHPDACDTLEGITEWWVTREIINVKIQEVSAVVSILISRGLLVEKKTSASVARYHLNKDKVDEIRTLINDRSLGKI